MFRSIYRSVFNKNNNHKGHKYTFDWESKNDVSLIINSLNQYGGVCIKGFFKEDQIKKSFQVDNLYKIYFSKKMNYKDVKNINYENIKGPILRGQKSFLTSNKFWEKRLISPDKGLVDIFNYEFNKSQINIINQLNIFTSRIVEKAFPQIFKKGFANLYLYKNVRTPRCFHRDGFLPRLKVFLILKGTYNLKQGPYSFHPFSHQNKFFRFKFQSAYNRIFGSDLGISSSDSTFCSFKNMVPLYNNIGDIIITRQDCTHGDLPAIVPHKKAMLVINYFCK